MLLEISEDYLKNLHEDKEFLLSVIKDIYANCGEDKEVAKRCNEVLDSLRFL